MIKKRIIGHFHKSTTIRDCGREGQLALVGGWKNGSQVMINTAVAKSTAHSAVPHNCPLFDIKTKNSSERNKEENE